MKKPLKRLNNIRMRKNNTTSLYIHIPFCETICDYCDFTKLQYFRNIAIKYLKALKDELVNKVKNKEEIKTIYIGGGTPTALDDDLFEELLLMVDPYSCNVKEYTIECNPESLSLNKIKMMKKYHINRVSIGVESTDDRVLKAINRPHTFEDVKVAVKNLRDNGLDNINLDLILGLPNVSIKMLEKDIFNILSLNPNHISCYSLTVNPHTIFYLNDIEPPSEEFAYEAYLMVDNLLKKNGYEHYEVSNWAKPGYRSEHNLTYWRNEHYYGIGLGASGYEGDIRYKNTANLNKYLEGDRILESEMVDLADKKKYQIMLNLRTLEGLNLDKFKEEFGEDLYLLKKREIDEFIKSGHLVMVGNTLIPTFDGMMILDTITLKLFD